MVTGQTAPSKKSRHKVSKSGNDMNIEYLASFPDPIPSFQRYSERIRGSLDGKGHDIVLYLIFRPSHVFHTNVEKCSLNLSPRPFPAFQCTAFST